MFGLDQRVRNLIMAGVVHDKVGDTYFIDAKDMKCPMPVLTTKKLLETEVKKGEKVVVQVSDPSFEIDFFVMCGIDNYQLLSKEKQPNGLLVFTIQK